MHIHILGICGTFMGGIAQIAREAGHQVTGCDKNVYPPMSDALRNAGIEIMEGYDVSQLDAVRPDVFVIGNAISRGNPLLEAILNRGLSYTSGRSDRHPILPFSQTRLLPWVFSIICPPHPNHQENKSRALFRARGF